MDSRSSENEPGSALRISRRELIKRGLAAGFSLGAVGYLGLSTRARAEESIREVKEGPIVELIREYLRSNQTPGVAVALYDAGHDPAGQLFAEGYANWESQRPVRPEQIFGIGSVTKVFTSTLLAFQPDIFNDPLSHHLPVKAENSSLRQIKIVDLATHTSGFPRDVTGLGRDGGKYLFNDQRPPEDSALAKLWRNWSPTQPRNGYCRNCEPGSCWNYSNVGFVTLGFVVAGDRYNQLLKEKITGPLSMSGTAAQTRKEFGAADGYVLKNGQLHATGAEDVDLKASAKDMIQWIQAQVQSSQVSDRALGAAIARTHEKHFLSSSQCPVEQPIGFDMGLGWQMHPLKPTDLIVSAKDGGSFLAGQSCWVGFIESKQLGVAVLTNLIGGKTSPATLGLRILRQRLGVES